MVSLLLKQFKIKKKKKVSKAQSMNQFMKRVRNIQMLMDKSTRERVIVTVCMLNNHQHQLDKIHNN